ncbi:hypothetical protein RYX36_020631, partial [Vicia faba]
MLDLVETSMEQSGIKYRRLDGRMTLTARDIAVKDFNTDPEITVMLMSLKAGNLGLNMVSACHVILLDLWWNPTTEDEAIDRAHRIGQTRPVTVTRITIKDTVEDRIMALQDEKRKMVASAFGKDHTGDSGTRLTFDDLKYLFMAYAAAGTVNQNYANILLMLLRLHQACDHPLLVKEYNSDPVGKDSVEMAKRLPKEMLINLEEERHENVDENNSDRFSITQCIGETDTHLDALITRYAHTLTNYSLRNLGYPTNQDFNYEALAPLLQFHLNNAGDPFLGSSFSLNSMKFEVRVLDWFAKLWEIEKNEYWGYVTTGGTEGNLHGILVG